MKSLIFWVIVLAAAVGIYQVALRQQTQAQAASVSGEWLLAGDPKQPCAITRNGEVLILVNERGDIATGRMTGETTLQVIKGDNWEPGVTAELKDSGKSLAWRDGSVWKRR